MTDIEKHLSGTSELLRLYRMAVKHLEPSKDDLRLNGLLATIKSKESDIKRLEASENFKRGADV